MEADSARAPKPHPVCVLVDGSNVAYGNFVKSTPRLDRILAVQMELRKYIVRCIIFVDASLRHTIDKEEELEALIASNAVIQTPAGRLADDFILQIALKRQEIGDTVYILTNDRFPEKNAQGRVPRIAFLVVPMQEGEEWYFHPELESIVEESQKESVDVKPSTIQASPSIAVVSATETIPNLNEDLLTTFFNFIITSQPPVEVGSKVAFTQVAGYLHNQWDGNFNKKFGYKKPKEFAIVLEQHGYITLHTEGLVLSLIINKKTIDRCIERSLEKAVPTSGEAVGEPLGGTEEKILQQVWETLKEEHHLPTEEKITIKMRSLNPSGELRTKKLIEKGVKAKTIEREERGDQIYYWPITGRWEAIDPNNPEDTYSPEQWKAFESAIQLLPSQDRTAQTRYHMALHIKNTGGGLIAQFSQANVEHMVQLAVKRGVLERVSTVMGARISVPMAD